MADTWARSALLLAVVALGCTPSGTSAPPIAQLPERIAAAGTDAAPSATLALTVETGTQPEAGYHTSYIRQLDWEVVDGTLTNADGTIPTLSRSAAATVDAQLARRASLVFTPVKAAGGFTLSLSLKRRDRAGVYQVVASGAKTNFTLSPGANTATVTLAPTATGQLQVSVPTPTIQFSPPPVVSSWTPTAASPGMLVTISGSNFSTTAGANQVTFNGTAGTVSAEGATQLVAEVPTGATTGLLNVISDNRLGKSTSNFTVLASGTVLGTYGVGANPYGIKRDSAGNMWIANSSGTTIYRLSPSGSVLDIFPASSTPYQLTFDLNGDLWYVTDTGSYNNIYKMSPSGANLATTGTEPFAVDVAVDSAGYAYTAASSNGKLHRFKPNGASDLTYDSPVGSSLTAIAIDASDNLWVAVGDAGKVMKMAPGAASLLGTYIVGSQPSDLAVDGSGNVWVAIDAANKVVKLLPNGTIAGTYNCPAAPKALSIDPLGNIWLAHTSLSKVTKMSPAGAILGTYSLAGNPNDIAFDATRAVWVTLGNINSVVKLAL